MNRNKKQSEACENPLSGKQEAPRREKCAGNVRESAREFLILLFSIFALSTTVFFVSRMAPGDPLVSYYGDRVERMSPQERAWAEEKLGLDDGIAVQYMRWLKEAAHGDFGISYKYKQDVVTVIQNRVGNTLLLGGLGFVVIFFGSLFLGILCAWRENGILDRFFCRIGTITSCIPEFWLSLVLILIFSAGLHWLPSSGAYTAGKAADLTDRLRHLILPLSMVVLSHLWYYAFLMRNRILEEIRGDYVLLARAKGMRKGRILLGHCLRGAMPSYLSIMAIAVPHILGGTYVVETVFSYPGIGTLTYESARYKDYNLLMLLCILSGILVILCSMAAGKINEWLDPRLRVTCGERNAQETERKIGQDAEACDAEEQANSEIAEMCSVEEQVKVETAETRNAGEQENGTIALWETAAVGLTVPSNPGADTAEAAESLWSESAACRIRNPESAQLPADIRFRIVGIRPSAAVPAQKKVHWYQDKPLLPILVLTVIVLGCICADWIMPKDPSYMDLLNCSVHPGKEFLFGTDTMGRDIFSMIWSGGRISLTIGVLASLIAAAIAILYGAVSGCAPAWLDELLMRLSEIFLSVPNLLLVILLQAAFGKAGILSLSVVIGVTSWAGMAKVVRTEVRQIRNSEYVIAARAMGGGFFYILRRHLTPNFIASILFMAVMNVRSAITAESTLSYMGIGLPLEMISWGSMLSLAEKAMSGGAWWIIVIPGAFLVGTLLCITDIGEAMRRQTNRKESNL